MDMRRCEILKDGSWQSAEFKKLQRGDVFRLFESDGTAVSPLHDGAFAAKGEPYMHEGGAHAIECVIGADEHDA